MAKDNDFATWLRAALAGRPNVYLVRNSGLKDNGRPVIDDSRVSKWLKGEQRPSMELAILAARVLGGSPAEALSAAGHPYGHSLTSLERMSEQYPLPATPTVTAEQLDRLRRLHAELANIIEEIGGAEDAERSAATKEAGSGRPALQTTDDMRLEYDDDLDALPDERDELGPRRGGLELPHAARRDDR